MKQLSLFFLPIAFLACDENRELDTMPPAAPRGIRSVSLDNAISLSWLANTEPDVDYYRLWKSDRYDGAYDLIGTTGGTSFVDYSTSNGITRYYAVSAVDFSDNESPLSSDVLYDTPRPEGLGVQLWNAVSNPQTAGYDFSTYSVGPHDDQFTDFYFDDSRGLDLLSVWSDTDIQDMGYTSSLDEISYAPVEGWAPSGTAEVIPGHTYIIWTWDDHYAKVRVLSVSSTGILFDWAYQTAEGNTELRAVRDHRSKRAPLTSREESK